MKPAPTHWSVIDTETSGFFNFKQPADAPGQPRLVELAIVRISDRLEIVSEYSALILPQGWEVDDKSEAFAKHGYTTSHLMQHGRPIDEALDAYKADVESGRAVAAFNAQFDTKMMRAEFRRAAQPDLFEKTPNTCLMRACGPLKIKKANGKGGYPGLADAYRHLFSEDMPGRAHGALDDARNAARILIKLAQMGVLPAPEVHYAAGNKEGAPF